MSEWATSAERIAFFVRHEQRVWDALVAGDAAADRAALADSFVGVYPSGVAGADGHAAQLHDGPTVERYAIERARTLEIADGHVMLTYRADYRRIDSEVDESMYVSSLWSRFDDGWLNVFSQDSPVGDPVV